MPRHFEIVAKRQLAPETYRLDVRAEDIARKRRAGQFVILRVREDGERFPLTIADSDIEKGTITLVVQAVGKSTHLLTQLNVGDRILDLAGPLGNPTHVKRYGTVACVGGGVGIAPLWPIARAMKRAGNRVLAALGARSGDLMILEDEFRKFAEKVSVCTDDGSYGKKGLVTDLLRDFVASEPVDLVVAIGPVPMMKAVSALTRTIRGPDQDPIPTVVSLNPIMIDGTGMCGGCRVLVGGEVKFACVDGPEFDGHLVDFDTLALRLRAYNDKEADDRRACKIGLPR
ncbi:MAG: sulfide/dihydroorotate dehydrogenase-like FAD/NAD-binding protein [Planctomycetia bacterium]|nr:sulfide/dihydroorotate dehydrogenase-like FAD/NAD-binding protein [Planctomycetia bacterium]